MNYYYFHHTETGAETQIYVSFFERSAGRERLYRWYIFSPQILPVYKCFIINERVKELFEETAYTDNARILTHLNSDLVNDVMISTNFKLEFSEYNKKAILRSIYEKERPRKLCNEWYKGGCAYISKNDALGAYILSLLDEEFANDIYYDIVVELNQFATYKQMLGELKMYIDDAF